MSATAGASQYMTYVLTFGCAWTLQANVWQRISDAKNVADARKMTVMSFFADIPLYLIVVFTGMAEITMFNQLPEGGIVTAIMMHTLGEFKHSNAIYKDERQNQEKNYLSSCSCPERRAADMAIRLTSSPSNTMMAMSPLRLTTTPCPKVLCRTSAPGI